MPKKRGNNEGTIVRRKDGRWMASITIGRDPATGKPKRAWFYGKTRQEAADQLVKALRDKGQGLLVAPHKMTVGEWLQSWLQDYKKPEIRSTTFNAYETLIRCHIQPALGHIPLTQLRPDHLQRFYNEKAQTGRVRGAGGLHPKTARSQRTIPLPAACVTARRRHKARQAEEKLLLGQVYHDHGLGFCREDGTPIDPRSFLYRFQRMLQQAGLPKVRLHDARHTFATLMLEIGESPKTVQTLLGHSNVATTLNIYSHVSLELEARAVARLDAALQAQTTARRTP